MFKISLAISGALLLSACAAIYNKTLNNPLPDNAPAGMYAAADIARENMIALSFSGGGMRAAAFASGALDALQSIKTPEGDLLDDVSFVTAVSGGALTAAHLGVYGRERRASFRDDVLLQDFERNIRTSFTNPMNLLRMLAGGMNSRANFGETLDRSVFKGATFADLHARPRPEIRINATDLYNRVAFPFIPRVFALICSDLNSYKVADAVAASMAVPLIFAPVTLKTYPESCQEPIPDAMRQIHDDPDASRLLKAASNGVSGYRDGGRMRYIKLGDGGLTDNYGLSSILVSRAIMGTAYAPMTRRDAVTVRRMLFIIVDAAQGPGGNWAMEEAGPAGFDLALQASAVAVDAAARLADDAFSRMLKEWRNAVVEFRCGLSDTEVRQLGVTARWKCDDVRFSLAHLAIDLLEEPDRGRLQAIPTRLTLDSRQVDTTIDGAHRGMLALPKLKEYVDDRLAESR